MNEQQTCGKGLAEHSVLPAKLGKLIAALADNLETHLPTIDVTDDNGQREQNAYVSLVQQYKDLGARLDAAAAEMASYRDLPMARHSEAAFSDPGILAAFENYVKLEGEILALLKDALERDQQMLGAMRAMQR